MQHADFCICTVQIGQYPLVISVMPTRMVSALSIQPEPQNQEEEAIRLIVHQASQGHEDAWRGLVDAYSRRVFAMARSRLNDDDLAEEITQSVFVTVATKLCQDGYNEQGRFEPWLFRITMNRVRDEFRRRKRHAKPTDPTHLQDTRTQDEPSTNQPTQSNHSLKDAISQLNETDREIIELRHHGQLSFKQISELLNQPVGTLLARHHRALKKLKAMLNPDDNTSPPKSTPPANEVTP
ncbi:MAG: sigma-70 family RNA polymerase sigma factor [Phycisphaerales bacterium]|nr:sigma-70 family RNA polymerase sigma factor [Phycisphaerales bacterium]